MNYHKLSLSVIFVLLSYSLLAGTGITDTIPKGTTNKRPPPGQYEKVPDAPVTNPYGQIPPERSSQGYDKMPGAPANKKELISVQQKAAGGYDKMPGAPADMNGVGTGKTNPKILNRTQAVKSGLNKLPPGSNASNQYQQLPVNNNQYKTSLYPRLDGQSGSNLSSKSSNPYQELPLKPANPYESANSRLSGTQNQYQTTNEVIRSRNAQTSNPYQELPLKPANPYESANSRLSGTQNQYQTTSEVIRSRNAQASNPYQELTLKQRSSYETASSAMGQQKSNSSRVGSFPGKKSTARSLSMPNLKKAASTTGSTQKTPATTKPVIRRRSQ